ncbi:hypothetical protein FJY63_09495, partial [Candidatus Sumerlaeota bacterium]|nr:hypothetical protein [Candidatus Sumerlaeota bacterium]
GRGMGGMGGMYGGGMGGMMMGRYGMGSSGRGMGSVRLIVRTATSQSSDVDIQEFRSEVFEDYEIYVERVRSSPIPGEGSATLRITYRPMYQY